jgi:hypothetical protein
MLLKDITNTILPVDRGRLNAKFEIIGDEENRKLRVSTNFP